MEPHRAGKTQQLAPAATTEPRHTKNKSLTFHAQNDLLISAFCSCFIQLGYYLYLFLLSATHGFVQQDKLMLLQCLT